VHNVFVIQGANVALNKSVSTPDELPRFPAERAVDGDAETACICSVWWSVDLGRLFVLTGIKIINSNYIGK